MCEGEDRITKLDVLQKSTRAVFHSSGTIVLALFHNFMAGTSVDP